MTIAALARPEIRHLHAYQAAVLPPDTLRLSNNEAAHVPGSRELHGLNRYPDIRPAALTSAMARHYGVAADHLLATRGSSEGIDLLIRTFCTAGRDAVLISSPAFELYRIYAAVQGAAIVDVPLLAGDNFALDTDALLSAADDNTKLMFLCSPNNPVGTIVPREEILRIVEARAGKSVVIVDEAYIEYSEAESLAPLVGRFDNLVVLRTLSKAHALAGARCGAVLGAPPLVRLLDGVLAPYAVSSPIATRALQALSGKRLAESRALADRTIAERKRLQAALRSVSAILHAWPSQANFVLVRLRDAAAARRRLDAAGIAVRMFDGTPALENCARITVAGREDNDRLLDALRSLD